LLAEHSGVVLQKDTGELGRVRGLVDYLNRLVDSSHSRLRHHPMDTSFDESEWLRALTPENLALDPKRPLFAGEPEKQDFPESFRSGKRISWINNVLPNIGTEGAEVQHPSSSPTGVSSMTLVTQERQDLFARELVNLRLLGNIDHMQFSGRLPWSLVLAAALLATVLWWWLPQGTWPPQ